MERKLNARILFFIFMLFSASSFAGENRNLELTRSGTQVSGQRIALVIGNSSYQSSPLKNPVNDATDVANELQQLGFQVILKRDASQREMKQAIREFGSKLRRAQAGLFYFAGHAVQIRGNNFLIPVEANIANEADAEDLSVNVNYILRTMEISQVKVSIVILDACRNNPFARSFRSVSSGLAQMSAATGSLIAFATAPGAVAADGSGRNGLYTRYLLKSLREPNSDILKVFQRVRANVVRDTEGRQTPWESTSLIGDFYFNPAEQGSPANNQVPAVAMVQPPAEVVHDTPPTEARADFPFDGVWSGELETYGGWFEKPVKVDVSFKVKDSVLSGKVFMYGEMRTIEAVIGPEGKLQGGFLKGSMQKYTLSGTVDQIHGEGRLSWKLRISLHRKN